MGEPGRCGGCKHWDRVPGAESCECLRVTADDEGLAWVFNAGPTYAGLWTRADFGCVLFEAAPDEGETTDEFPLPWRADGEVVVDANGDDVFDWCYGGAGMARRVAACVNACAGVPTAALEAGAVAGLLAACEAAIEARDPNRMTEILQAAVARVAG